MPGVSPSTSLPGEIRASTWSRSSPVRQRQLDEDPVDLGIGVEQRDELVQVPLIDVGRQLVVDRADPGRLAGLALVGDVDVRGGVLADQHRCKARACARASATTSPTRAREIGRNGLAVDDLRAQLAFWIGA